MNKTALITGINGQDGSYLAEFLVEKGYTVYGILKRNSVAENQTARIPDEIFKKLNLRYADLTDLSSLISVIKEAEPDEVYNLAAQSHVRISFDQPLYTVNATGIGALNVLEAVRLASPQSKVYQASSSEMYGDVIGKSQNEKTPFNPQSPYAISKLFAHNIAENYRKSYNMFIVSGILFNHESPLRGEEFVTRKIVRGLVDIINNNLDYLELGNLEAKRDWGYAKEYVEIMWKMMQKNKPDTYVVSTGKTYSIKDFINLCINYLGIKAKWVGSGLNKKLIEKKTNRTLIKINKKFFRPAEVNYLKGDSGKAKKDLNWHSKTSLKELVKIMIDEELKYYSKN